MAWHGIATFGNSLNVLYRHQVTPLGLEVSNAHNHYHIILSEYSSCPEWHVKFVLEPWSSLPETFPEDFELSKIKRNSENMLDVDSCISSYQRLQQKRNR